MYENDHDTLAAEYVLGTLSNDEREQAEALIAIDAGFEAAVRQWERRLGELNVMVEAVEPPPELWDRIKTDIAAPDTLPQLGAVASADLVEVTPIEEAGAYSEGELPQGVAEDAWAAQPQGEAEAEAEAETAAWEEQQGEAEPAWAEPSAEEEHEEGVPREDGAIPEWAPATEPEAEALPEHEFGVEDGAEPHDERIAALYQPRAGVERRELSPLAALASSLTPPSEEAESTSDVRGMRRGRGADPVRLARRAKRWRRTALLVGTIAALLAIYIAVWQVAPDLMPTQWWPEGVELAGAPAAAPGQLPQDRLVAVLQQEPTLPAFLLTFDIPGRKLIVRRVAATPERGRSYELWLLSNRFQGARSLGLIDNAEFTQRALPGSYDAATLRSASYAISLEPVGGSPKGTPTGPVLFTGKAVELSAGYSPAAEIMIDVDLSIYRMVGN